MPFFRLPLQLTYLVQSMKHFSAVAVWSLAALATYGRQLLHWLVQYKASLSSFSKCLKSLKMSKVSDFFKTLCCWDAVAMQIFTWNVTKGYRAQNFHKILIDLLKFENQAAVVKIFYWSDRDDSSRYHTLRKDLQQRRWRPFCVLESH